MSNQAVTWALEFSKNRGADKFVLVLIAWHVSGDSGYAWPGIVTLARESGMSEPGVRAAIERLKESGELEYERGGIQGRDKSTFFLPGFALWMAGVLGVKEGLKGVIGVSEGETRGKRGVSGSSVTETKESELGLQKELNIKEEKEVITQPLKESEQIKPLEREERRAIPKPEKKVKERKWPPKTYREFVKATPAKEVRKTPVEFIKFCRIFSQRADVAAVTHPELWDLPTEIAAEIGWENLEERLEVYIDQVDKVNGYTARDFLMGGWQTVTGEEYKMRQLDGKPLGF